MPIRFRCGYCKQLMAIGSRKKGTVVRCPKCSGQMVVPESSQADRPSSSAKTGGPAAGDATPNPFDLGDIEILSRPGDDNPFAFGPEDVSQAPISGVFLTSKHLVLAGSAIFFLLVAAFALGWFLGRG